MCGMSGNIVNHLPKTGQPLVAVLASRTCPACKWLVKGKRRRTIGKQPGTNSCRQRNSLVVNRSSHGCQTSTVFPVAVYVRFLWFALTEARAGCLSSVFWKSKWKGVLWPNRSAPPCPAPASPSPFPTSPRDAPPQPASPRPARPRSAVPFPTPSRPWDVRVYDSTTMLYTGFNTFVFPKARRGRLSTLFGNRNERSGPGRIVPPVPAPTRPGPDRPRPGLALRPPEGMLGFWILQVGVIRQRRHKI